MFKLLIGRYTNFIIMFYYKSLVGYAFFAIFTLLLFQGCQFDNSKIKFERFEFLDEITGKADFKDENLKHLNNKVLSKAYIVHGFEKKYEKEITEIIDQYFCDSILPDIHFNRNLYIEFFKTSKNTNREKFEERRSRRRKVHARSHDILLHFSLFHPNDSTLWITKQKIAENGKPNPPEEKFYCD